MENKEYLQDLKKLINGEMVAAMQYKIIADSIVGDKNLSYIQSHCEEHYQEELDHYTMLVNALMQREDNVELNLSTLVGEALPETVEMTSNNCLDAAEFFSKTEDDAINAYLEFHERIKDVDPDLDDIITGIISDERDHKLDFDRVIDSDEELEVEDSEDDIEDESDDTEEESDESKDEESEKKDKFNFDFSDDEDEEIKESRKMRNRLNKSKRLKEGPSAAYKLTIKDLELNKDSVRVLGKKDKDTYKFSVEVEEDLYEFSVDHSYWGGSGEEYIYGKLFGYYNIEDTDEEVEELIKEDLPDYVTISSVYGSGYSHSVLNEDFILEDKKYLISDEYFFRFEGHSENLGDSIEEIKENNLEESKRMRNRVKESRKPNRSRKLKETKISYDLLDGNFKPWSGAVSRWDEILENDLLEELDAYLEDIYPEGMSETELNDFLWFDGDEFLDIYLGRNQDDDYDDSEESEDDSEEFEEFVNRRINRVRERSERPSRSFIERKLHNKEKYSDSINRFAKRIR